MTQSELAKKAGVSVPTLRLLERGQGNIFSWNKAIAALSLCLAPKDFKRRRRVGHWIQVHHNVL